MFDSENKYLPSRRNLDAAVEAGDSEDFIAAETLLNSRLRLERLQEGQKP